MNSMTRAPEESPSQGKLKLLLIYSRRNFHFLHHYSKSLLNKFTKGLQTMVVDFFGIGLGDNSEFGTICRRTPISVKYAADPDNSQGFLAILSGSTVEPKEDHYQRVL